MRRLTSVFSLVLLAGLSGLTAGCYFTRSPSRPLPALEFRRSVAEREGCLVVFFPGFLDGPDTFEQYGFPRDVLGSGAHCDSVAIDLHYRYYGEMGVADLVYEDVLAPAVVRGYREIWLVGISMGGLGALLTAQRHPELVQGIILLAPFVGEESTVREIDAAGGPAAWRPPHGLASAPWTQENYTQHLWAWLRRYHTDPDAMPPLYIGWGADDRLGPADRLLASMQPEGHVFTTPGAHNWATWTPLFRHFLEVAEPGH